VVEYHNVREEGHRSWGECAEVDHPPRKGPMGGDDFLSIPAGTWWARVSDDERRPANIWGTAARWQPNKRLFGAQLRYGVISTRRKPGKPFVKYDTPDCRGGLRNTVIPVSGEFPTDQGLVNAKDFKL